MDFEHENKLQQRIDDLVKKNFTLSEAAMESFRETASTKTERDRLAAENAELREHLEYSRNEALELRKHRKPLRDLAAANATLEVLLAREAEVLKKMHPGPRTPIDYPRESAARIKWRHRREFYRSMAAILNPETNDER